MRQLRFQQLPPRPALASHDLTPEENAQYLAQGVQSALQVQQRAFADNTVRRQQAAIAEFSQWLQVHGQGAEVTNCTPEHVMAYMELHWIPRRSTPKRAAAPSSVTTTLSLLSTQFRLLGRGQAYDELACDGNPCQSSDLLLYRRGVTRGAGQDGYQEQSATPLSYELLRTLVQHIRAQVPKVTLLDQLLLHRDVACYTLMWATASRGHDCGKLRLDDFRDPADHRRAYPGQSFPLPSPPSGQYPAGYHLVLAQLGTKTYQGRRAPTVLIPPALDADVCPVRALATYTQACLQPGVPPGSPVTEYLFRPLTRGHRGFRNAAMSSSGMAYRLRQHLQNAGEYTGESCHSFRRGVLQHAQTGGATEGELLALGQIRSTSTLKRYLDPTRHVDPETRFQAPPPPTDPIRKSARRPGGRRNAQDGPQ